LLGKSGLASVAKLLGEVSEFAMAKLLKISPVAIERRSDEISKKTMLFFKVPLLLRICKGNSANKSVFVKVS
jgi:hypothetical protein